MSSQPAAGAIAADQLRIEVGQGAQRVEAVRDLSLRIAPGEFVCLLGPSGCGKSTLLAALAGHLQPTHGTLLLDGEPITGPDPQRGLVFQQPTLFPWKRLLDNVAFGLKMRGRLRGERDAAARSMLAQVGLTGFEQRYPFELSGGMQQRAELARVLLNHPRVLLMDEPFGALDALTRHRMQALLLELWTGHRTTVVFVTHDIDEALFLGDRVLVMGARPGRIIEDLSVDLPRPRHAGLSTEPAFNALKRHCLAMLSPSPIGPGVPALPTVTHLYPPDPPRPMQQPPWPDHDGAFDADPTLAAPARRLAEAEDPTVRRLALIELAESEAPAALPWLVRALADPSPLVRREAAAALAGRDEESAVLALCAALRDADAAVCDTAAASLAELRTPALAPLLLAPARDADPFVRAAALRALREQRWPGAVGPARAALGHADARVRREAVGVLGWLKASASLPLLAALAVDDPVPEVRRAATGALGAAAAASAPGPATSALQQALADPDWTVREEAATVLGKLRHAPATAALVDALRDAQWQVRLRAARALGQLAARAAVAPLCAALTHQVSNLRKEAALALGSIGDPAAQGALLIARQDADPDVRKAAALALSQLAIAGVA